VAVADHAEAAAADKDVLVEIGHADDFMRYDLADRQDQIVGLVEDPAVDFDRYVIVDTAFGDLFHE